MAGQAIDDGFLNSSFVLSRPTRLTLATLVVSDTWIEKYLL